MMPPQPLRARRPRGPDGTESDTAAGGADSADLVGRWTYADEPGVLEMAVEDDRSVSWSEPPAEDDPDRTELSCAGRVSEMTDSEMPFEIFLACKQTSGTDELSATVMYDAALTGPDELSLVGDSGGDTTLLARTG